MHNVRNQLLNRLAGGVQGKVAADVLVQANHAREAVNARFKEEEDMTGQAFMELVIQGIVI